MRKTSFNCWTASPPTNAARSRPPRSASDSVSPSSPHPTYDPARGRLPRPCDPWHLRARPFGQLGTRAASQDIALAVGAAFSKEPHRIAFRSALDHHGLLIHPARTVQVAMPRRVDSHHISGRRLQPVHETPDTIDIGSEDAGHGACVFDASSEHSLRAPHAPPSRAAGRRSPTPSPTPRSTPKSSQCWPSD